jgi:hypothetical protein
MIRVSLLSFNYLDIASLHTVDCICTNRARGIRNGGYSLALIFASYKNASSILKRAFTALD